MTKTKKGETKGSKKGTGRSAKAKAKANAKPVKAIQRPLRWDLTCQDAEIQIVSSRTGKTAFLRIEQQSQFSRFRPGRRLVKLFTGTDYWNAYHWTCFGEVDDHGIHVFGTKMGSGSAPSKWDQYAAMLSETRRFQKIGCIYKICLLD